MPAPVYLDYAATTPVDPRVAELMAHYLTLTDGLFGNPDSSSHVFGQRAKAAVDLAREQVASLLHASPAEIIWTSGATESNNLALKGIAHQYTEKGRHLVTCKSEHKAVLDVCRQLEREGFEISYLDPEPDGRLDPTRLAAALRDDTILVSLMHVNNELGGIHDLEALGTITRSRGVLFHVDAAQSVGKRPINLQTLAVDLLSISGHKLYAPKGIGVLYLCRRPRIKLQALIHGGGQERGLRAGTLPTHQIVALGKAAELAAAEMAADELRIRGLRARLWDSLQTLGGVQLNGCGDRSISGILNVSFAGIDSEALLMALDDVSLSAGSACSSAVTEPSHVLQSIGLDSLQARSAVRISLGRFTSAEEIDFAATRIGEEVSRLRELSPLWGVDQMAQSL